MRIEDMTDSFSYWKKHIVVSLGTAVGELIGGFLLGYLFIAISMSWWGAMSRSRANINPNSFDMLFVLMFILALAVVIFIGGWVLGGAGGYFSGLRLQGLVEESRKKAFREGAIVSFVSFWGLNSVVGFIMIFLTIFNVITIYDYVFLFALLFDWAATWI
jgi:hypothetical protein